MLESPMSLQLAVFRFCFSLFFLCFFEYLLVSLSLSPSPQFLSSGFISRIFSCRWFMLFDLQFKAQSRTAALARCIQAVCKHLRSIKLQSCSSDATPNMIECFFQVLVPFKFINDCSFSLLKINAFSKCNVFNELQKPTCQVDLWWVALLSFF